MCVSFGNPRGTIPSLAAVDAKGSHTQRLLLEEEEAGIQQLQIFGEIVQLFDGLLAHASICSN